MNNIQIAVIVGSLRKASFNLCLANAIIKMAPANMTLKLVEIDDLPLYNQDDDEQQAESVKRMKAKVHQCDAVLFVTPEYNRSIPGVLKNALDHGSRPSGHNSWGKKPAAIIGISPSPVGTASAQQHLRCVLAALDMPTLCHPEMFLQMQEDFFDESGGIGESSKKFFKVWLDRFGVWVTTNKGL